MSERLAVKEIDFGIGGAQESDVTPRYQRSAHHNIAAVDRNRIVIVFAGDVFIPPTFREFDGIVDAEPMNFIRLFTGEVIMEQLIGTAEVEGIIPVGAFDGDVRRQVDDDIVVEGAGDHLVVGDVVDIRHNKPTPLLL